RTSSKLTWTLHKYITFPFSPTFSGAQVVSDRAVALPNAKGLGIRQTVVRIRSRQSTRKPITSSSSEASYTKMRDNSSNATTADKLQDCTEYVVLQRFMVKGDGGEWKIWGLAEETTPKQVDCDPGFASGLSVRDRIAMLTGR